MGDSERDKKQNREDGADESETGGKQRSTGQDYTAGSPDPGDAGAGEGGDAQRREPSQAETEPPGTLGKP